MTTADLQKKFRDSLPSDLKIEGEYVSLEPLCSGHVNDLKEAVQDGELWKLRETPIPTITEMEEYIQQAIKQRERGRQLPFIVRRFDDGKIVGTTRYYNISSVNRNLSIGYTWYSASAQRTVVNTECKLLLLTHAFENSICISVQWHTHGENTRSQNAIMRLGASFEGVLRNHTILEDGRISDVHCFSMLNTEWQNSKRLLQERVFGNT